MSRKQAEKEALRNSADPIFNMYFDSMFSYGDDVSWLSRLSSEQQAQEEEEKEEKDDG